MTCIILGAWPKNCMSHVVTFMNNFDINQFLFFPKNWKIVIPLCQKIWNVTKNKNHALLNVCLQCVSKFIEFQILQVIPIFVK
jgi:hypothetical protein